MVQQNEKRRILFFKCLTAILMRKMEIFHPIGGILIASDYLFLFLDYETYAAGTLARGKRVA